MNVSLLKAREIPNGYTWTLASRLGEMLNLAEEMFGPRNKDFTILGFEFMDTGPRIWYPNNNGNIVIQLTPEALNSETIALYQLAHECIHLLSPSGGAYANVLEEGVAVYFSWLYLRKVLQVDGRLITDEAHYLTAGLIVEKALRLKPDFYKEARIVRPRIWEINDSDIIDLCSELSLEEARILATPFSQFIKSGFTKTTDSLDEGTRLRFDSYQE